MKTFLNEEVLLPSAMAFGLFCTWITCFMRTVELSVNDSVHNSPILGGKTSSQLFSVSVAWRVVFLIGDAVFVTAGAWYVTTLKEKLSWTFLLIGILMSTHINLVLRTWTRRTARYIEDGNEDSYAHIVPVLVAAALTACAIVMTLIPLITLPLFQRLENRQRLLTKLFLVIGTICFELVVPTALIEYAERGTAYSSMVLLLLNLALVSSSVGYGSIKTILLQKELEDFEIEPLTSASACEVNATDR